MKRAFDFFASLMLVLFFGPLLVLVAVLVWWNLGRPIFFRQTRPGLFGAPFELVKFRSMLPQNQDPHRLLADDQRLTRWGLWLRSTSLDEMPELWNVIKGDMSLVGPRPLLMEYLPRYDQRQARRHEVRPGITGWAQINGRNAISWEDKLELDVWYVENRSLALDLKILCLTVWKVIRREGISAEGEATTTPFLGTPERLEERPAPESGKDQNP